MRIFAVVVFFVNDRRVPVSGVGFGARPMMGRRPANQTAAFRVGVGLSSFHCISWHHEEETLMDGVVTGFY